LPSLKLSLKLKLKYQKQLNKKNRSHLENLLTNQRKIFDDMFAIAHMNNSACSYSAKYVRIHPIFMSIIFHHYRQLMQLTQRESSRLRLKKSI
jgi:hypothetical protein